jgi:hypothetical protein
MKWSSLVQQELELNEGQQQIDMISHPNSKREIILQFLWAKIKACHQFFLQVCTKAMLDVRCSKDQVVNIATLPKPNSVPSPSCFSVKLRCRSLESHSSGWDKTTNLVQPKSPAMTIQSTMEIATVTTNKKIHVAQS